MGSSKENENEKRSSFRRQLQIMRAGVDGISIAKRFRWKLWSARRMFNRRPSFHGTMIGRKKKKPVHSILFPSATFSSHLASAGWTRKQARQRNKFHPTKEERESICEWIIRYLNPFIHQALLAGEYTTRRLRYINSPASRLELTR